VLRLKLCVADAKHLAELETKHGRILEQLAICRANAGRLPVISLTAPGARDTEPVHFELPGSLIRELKPHEIRPARGAFRFRLRGGPYRPGSALGRTGFLRGELQTIDVGLLIVTSERVAFLGAIATEEISLADIVELTVYRDAVRLHVSGRQSRPLFQLGDAELFAAILGGAARNQLAKPVSPS